MTLHAAPTTGAAGSTAPSVADPLLADASMRQQLFCLWRLASYGVLAHERAAWILSGGAGVSFDHWPFDGSVARATWSGTVPAAAIAFVHTHPNGWSPRPSSEDGTQAATLGMPCYVISVNAIWRTDGASSVQLETGDWWRGHRARDCP